MTLGEGLALVAPRLVTGEDPVTASSWGWVGLILSVLLVAGVFALLVGRVRHHNASPAHAGHRMAKLVGLDERERATLHALARTAGTPSPALMLSRRVFRAARERALGTKRAPKPAALEALERRLFGDQPAAARLSVSA